MRVRLTLLIGILCTFPCFGTEIERPFFLGQSLAEIKAKNKLLPDPFDTSGLSQELQELLLSYYRTLGGSEVWEQVVSLLVEGEVRFAEGDVLQFRNYRMKPDLSKAIIYLPNGFEIIQAFNGKVSKEWLTFLTQESSLMPFEQSVEFIRDASLGGHLIFPKLAGKKMVYLGAEMVNGSLQHRIQVFLPNGQEIRYGLNALGYLVEEETEVLQNGITRRLEFNSFKKVSGMTMPYQGKVYYDDELVQSVRIKSIELNKGVYSWMFEM